jgi:hypothetical protein
MRQNAEDKIQSYIFTLIEAQSSIEHQEAILSNIK